MGNESQSPVVNHAKLLGWAALGLLAGGLALVSCSTLEPTVVSPPRIEGANFIGDRACLECHTSYSRSFAASPHARLRLDGITGQKENGCEACHGPGSQHLVVGGGRGKFIVNPGKDAKACFQCHLQTHAEFNLPQHHPVVEGRMNCVHCHDPHGADIRKPAGGLAMARRNESCATCHREQTKPFVFEHEAMREGCTVCHNPHGSVNAKLLVERDNNLCLKCHAQLPGDASNPNRIFIGRRDHTVWLRLGGCWSSGCHTAVHGSNFSPHQLY